MRTFEQYIAEQTQNEALNQQRDTNRYQNVEDRVNFGKKIEQQIIDQLSAKGWKITPATQEHDMYDKIDGWVEIDGEKRPFQVKYRDTGDDILMEMCLRIQLENVDPDNINDRIFNGRDAVGKASIYICLNKSGTLVRVCDANYAKSIAKGMAVQLIKAFKQNGERSITTSSGQAKLTRDPATGIPKLMVYMTPSVLKSQNIWIKKLWN